MQPIDQRINTLTYPRIDAGQSYKNATNLVNTKYTPPAQNNYN